MYEPAEMRFATRAVPQKTKLPPVVNGSAKFRPIIQGEKAPEYGIEFLHFFDSYLSKLLEI
jgi:hypothetical protein